jgi:thiamine biosynthesis protein ThiS
LKTLSNKQLSDHPKEPFMHIVYRDKEWFVDQEMTVNQMLKHLKLLPESVLVVCNGQLIAEDQKLQPGDEVKIVSVVSGG